LHANILKHALKPNSTQATMGMGVGEGEEEFEGSMGAKGTWSKDKAIGSTHV
jgi:hypothetical protein